VATGDFAQYYRYRAGSLPAQSQPSPQDEGGLTRILPLVAQCDRRPSCRRFRIVVILRLSDIGRYAVLAELSTLIVCIGPTYS
jgi:hypothetical protein